MRLERAQLALLAALAATVPLSIFASELLLGLSGLVLLVRLVRREARLSRTAVDVPLLAFAVWTLLSASFAADPARSHEDAKKLLLYALFYIALEVLERPGTRKAVLDAALVGGLALAALLVAQHHFLGFDRLDRRPHGFLGHYMSAAGVTMGVFLVATARLAFAKRIAGRPREAWPAAAVLLGVAVVATLQGTGLAQVATRLFVLAAALFAGAAAVATPAWRPSLAALPAVTAPVAAWALVVTQTRSAWLGAVVGLAVMALLRAPRALALAGAGLVLLLLARPAALTDRLTIGDASSVDRYYMWQAGIDMVVDRPVFGQGPGMILAEYPRYRWPEAPNAQQPHLHNNPLQVAAERGVPGLAFFLWWALVAFGAAVREARRASLAGPADWLAASAATVLAAVFAAGLFEYNLGDSEVLMLVLLLTAVPFALSRARAARAA